ncbi:hypothetical protein BZL29_1685 [Mycobacterium kansasii]|uniref:Uncharacterized protein n=1 Tax=Mycobacterium kansasii TaxID=1768 RepID=A0A1V3XL10_MYCKA|nr:hypothetical protein BZL29_1685 [Mycobacterium kansasii]
MGPRRGTRMLPAPSEPIAAVTRPAATAAALPPTIRRVYAGAPTGCGCVRTRARW